MSPKAPSLPGGGLPALTALLGMAGPPVVIFNAAHSGSRLLAAALAEAGVFMGSEVNDSGDATALVPLVRHVVEKHLPDIGLMMRRGVDAELLDLARRSFELHLQGRSQGQRWGWKLCETVFLLPLIAELFPQARFVHLVRDGRDVAFSPFVAPKDPFWRKVHFNTDRITSWHGLAMTQRAYRAQGHLFNAVRWVNSVSLGRAYGAMLGGRYREMRYEALVADFDREMEELLAWLDLPAKASGSKVEIRKDAVGKWRQQPKRAVTEALSVLEPTLSAFGYSGEATTSVPPFPRISALRRLLQS